jgi:hypothetical protein
MVPRAVPWVQSEARGSAALTLPETGTVQLAIATRNAPAALPRNGRSRFARHLVPPGNR